MNVTELYVKATGFKPYDFQRRVAENGLPELLRIPTGCGKTEAVGLGWLYRRRFHNNAEVRSATPHWLVIASPMRTLVEQTHSRFRDWLERLNLNTDIGIHMVRGGVDWSDNDWRLMPDRDAVFIGTIDMLLSRALNRGYADGRWSWPMSFGAFNNGVHWVFDEIQLMDVATPNTRQIQSFRDILGTALPTASTWMSATVDEHLLRTVDRPDIGSTIEISESDISGSLSRRLEAVRTVHRIELPDKKSEQELASKLIEYHRACHRPGTLTLAVLNTVDRATETWKSLQTLKSELEIVLLHSRYRPADRKARTEEALAPPGPEGKIVVSTQVLEAGIDLSATVLFTEAAPWPSIVQRAGRCNRDGAANRGLLLWAALPKQKSAPYEAADIRASEQALETLEGTPVTTRKLQNIDVGVSRRITPVIRRKDNEIAPEIVGTSSLWISRTPFAPGRHNRKLAWNEHVRDEIKRELTEYRDLPAPASVEVLEKEDPRQYRRYRLPPKESLKDSRRATMVSIQFDNPVKGPIVLGALSHFGLGMFIPG